MAWIPTDVALPGHPKLRRLKGALGINTREAVGLLHMLWSWIYTYCPDGDLTGLAASEIARSVEWRGSSERLITSLVGCGVDGGAGFLEIKEGRLLAHDWGEWGLKTAREKEKAAARQRKHRKACHGDVTIDQTVTSHLHGMEGEGREGYREIPPSPRGTNSPSPGGDSGSVHGEKSPRLADRVDPEKVLALWNEIMGDVARARDLTKARRAAIRARAGKDRDLEWFRTLFLRIAASPGLRGANDRGWKADLGWALKEENVVKVLEGKYDQWGTAGNGASRGPRDTMRELADWVEREEARTNGREGGGESRRPGGGELAPAGAKPGGDGGFMEAEFRVDPV